MKKLLFFLSLLSFLSVSNASMLLDKNYPLCIEDFYYKGGYLYYLRSSDGEWKSVSEDHQAINIHSGYIWDSNNEICKPEPYLILGMDATDWHFLLGLTGLLIGFVILNFTMWVFTVVGGKK